MKTRKGYVSNSSSSSYIVIPDAVYSDISSGTADYNNMRVFLDFSEANDWYGLFDEGEKQFGWQMENYHDTETKWNWLVLQAYYGGDEYINAIDRFLSEIHSNLKMDWAKVDDLVEDMEAYIDHQSVDAECTFSKLKKIGIKEFLVNEECYIHNSNDNGADY